MAAPTVTPASAGGTITANTINTVAANLQAVAGATETGWYAISGNGYAASAVISTYAQSLQLVSVPVSVSIAGTGHGALSAPSTNWLSNTGFQAYGTVSAANSNSYANGGWTLQY